MRLLLDTHIVLWAIADDDRLSANARALIDDPDNEVVVSAATVWEIAIKHAPARGGPNDMPISGQQALGYFKAAGFELLSISPAHIVATEALAPLHADPFDRILVAQTMAIPLRLLTHDQRVVAYSDSIIAV
nr:type II toxin-antitoxin system VapC family toxin [uncultured Rhodopila sp.]